MKFSLVLTRVFRAVLMDLSNWMRTLRARAGLSIWCCISSSRLSWRVWPRVVFLYSWYDMVLLLVVVTVLVGYCWFPPLRANTR